MAAYLDNHTFPFPHSPPPSFLSLDAARLKKKVDLGTEQHDSRDDVAGGSDKGKVLVARNGGGDGRAAAGAGAEAGAGGVTDSPPWQEVAVPRERSVRARDWRVVVETVRVVTGTESVDKAMGRRQLRRGEAIAGIEVELKEVRYGRVFFWGGGGRERWSGDVP